MKKLMKFSPYAIRWLQKKHAQRDLSKSRHSAGFTTRYEIHVWTPGLDGKYGWKMLWCGNDTASYLRQVWRAKYSYQKVRVTTGPR